MLGGAALAQTDPHVGVWKLNVAKSKYSPGPAPTSATTTMVAAGKGMKISVNQVMADGTKRQWEYTSNNDGTEAQVTGNNPEADTIVRSRVNARTQKSVSKKNGKVTITQTSEVSGDGKTRTVTTSGVNAKGEKVDNVALYERQ
jgi:hypothetical protein